MADPSPDDTNAVNDVYEYDLHERAEPLRTALTAHEITLASQLRALVSAVAAAESASTGKDASNASAFKQAQDALAEDLATLHRILDNINDAVARTSTAGTAGTTSKAADNETRPNVRVIVINVNGSAPGGQFNTASTSAIDEY
ncbi:hypothetical protein [Streptomyces yunnanensis]|uniref:Uncharacterized protein n=1 Tax=Streptomyces yunnanensis TaxID=156453 RepID=A0A9X8MKV8_9ACTN|nr:hypothetical protein [Streptomyces yunnanensis]SHK96211.1 hypothetical protein SAMN05216268_10272 [Streptomyces yunnanensis]